MVEENDEIIEIEQPELNIKKETREANGDDLSHLFRTPKKTDPDMYTDDLVSVSDNDVFGDGGADMSDLTDVPEELTTTEPKKRKTVLIRKIRRTNKVYNPTMGGFNA